MKKAKPALIFSVKLLVSAGLLTFVFTRVDFARFVNTFALANFSYIGSALPGYSFDSILDACPHGSRAPHRYSFYVLPDRLPTGGNLRGSAHQYQWPWLARGRLSFLLGLVGVSSEKGIAFGLLLFFIVAVDSLLGGIIFLLKRGAKPTALAEVEQ